MKIFKQIKMKEFTWWEKIRLLFKPIIIASDYGYGEDDNVVLTFKRLGNKFYLINEKHNVTPRIDL